MLTDERDVRPDTDRLPRWAAPPAPPQEEPPKVARGVAVRVVTAGAVAVLLLVIGHRWAAVLLLTVLGLSSLLSLAVPAVGAAIDRFIARFQVLVGNALSTVLLGLFHLAVFVPASLVLRLLRRDPLALGASPDDPSFWREAARPPGKPLHHRPFTYERHPGGSGRAARGLRSALGLATIVALLDLGIGSQVNGDPVAPVTAAEFTVPVPDVAAGRDEPWAEQLFAEISESYAGVTYHPYRGWTAADIAGEHLNVADGVRRSYESPLAATAADPVDVYFFGGSAMMGWFQRDEETIASELVKLAEADGIPVRAVNYGQAGYSIWQELLLLEEAVARGDVPDLAVFYDGANEIVAQFRAEGPTDAPTHLQARLTQAELEADPAAQVDDRPAWRQLLSDYSSGSAIAEVWRRARGEEEQQVRAQLEVLWPNPTEHGAERGEAAAMLHGRAVDLIGAISAEYGFTSSFFWQPWIYSKDVLPGEEGAVGSWATDPATWTTANDAALANVHDSVVDLSDALDDVDEPVMYDFVHTNEVGAEVMARALYDQLRPQLLALHQAQQPAQEDAVP